MVCYTQNKFFSSQHPIKLDLKSILDLHEVGMNIRNMFLTSSCQTLSPRDPCSCSCSYQLGLPRHAASELPAQWHVLQPGCLPGVSNHMASLNSLSSFWLRGFCFYSLSQRITQFPALSLTVFIRYLPTVINFISYNFSFPSPTATYYAKLTSASQPNFRLLLLPLPNAFFTKLP